MAHGEPHRIPNAGSGPEAARPATEEETSGAHAVLQRALDYLTYAREVPEVDLGSIPAERPRLLIPTKDNIRFVVAMAPGSVPRVAWWRLDAAPAPAAMVRERG